MHLWTPTSPFHRVELTCQYTRLLVGFAANDGQPEWVLSDPNSVLCTEFNRGGQHHGGVQTFIITILRLHGGWSSTVIMQSVSLSVSQSVGLIIYLSDIICFGALRH